MPTSRSAAGSELRRTATVRAVEQARASIVNIHGQKTVSSPDDSARRGDSPQHVNGMGTGVVIDQRGYIITNYHVVEGVKKIQVTLAGGQAYVATHVSHDPRTDLAVIKITAKEELPVITIGTSSDLMTGEPVIAVGNAYGYEHTVTRGIVSALHRTVHVSDAQQYQDLIQTDASINPGNSGGPLLNIDGEMIGINVAVRAGAQGIGFAIPVDMAMEIAARLMSVERIEGIVHGVKASSEAASRQEFVVGEVADESPAAKCGLRSRRRHHQGRRQTGRPRPRFRAGTPGSQSRRGNRAHRPPRSTAHNAQPGAGPEKPPRLEHRPDRPARAERRRRRGGHIEPARAAAKIWESART